MVQIRVLKFGRNTTFNGVGVGNGRQGGGGR